MIPITKIQNIFHTFWVEWTLVIHRHSSKEIRYSALGKEISIDTNMDTRTVITLVKNTRKIQLRLKWDDLGDIEQAVAKNLPFLDMVGEDVDTLIAPVSDILDADERRFYVRDINALFLMKQWETVNTYIYHPNISIESFSYEVVENEKEFFNSFWAHKRHATTHACYGLELYYQSESFSDVHADNSYAQTNEAVEFAFIDPIHAYLLQKSEPESPTIESGTHTVSIKNDVVASLLGILCDALTGEDIRQHTSFFSLDDIGRPALDPKLIIHSNPAREHSPFNRLFDFEGVTSEPFTIVENGVIKNVFLDTKNARKLWFVHTGNPGFSNLEVVGEGNSEYLKDSRFLFTNLMAFHTIDSISGKFALEGEWFEIVDGKLGNFVKNVSLSGNIRDLFNSIEAFGDDTYTHGNIFCPSITFRGQSVVV